MCTIHFLLFWKFNDHRWKCFFIFFFSCYLLEECNTWLNSCFFPVQLRLVLWPEKIDTMSFYVVSHPQPLFLVSCKKKSRQGWLQYIPAKGSAVHIFLVRKILFANTRPTNPLMYFSKKKWAVPIASLVLAKRMRLCSADFQRIWRPWVLWPPCFYVFKFQRGS